MKRIRKDQIKTINNLLIYASEEQLQKSQFFTSKGLTHLTYTEAARLIEILKKYNTLNHVSLISDALEWCDYRTDQSNKEIFDHETKNYNIIDTITSNEKNKVTYTIIDDNKKVHYLTITKQYIRNYATLEKIAAEIQKDYSIKASIKDIAIVLFSSLSGNYKEAYKTKLYNEESGIYCRLLEIASSERNYIIDQMVIY